MRRGRFAITCGPRSCELARALRDLQHFPHTNRLTEPGYPGSVWQQALGIAHFASGRLDFLFGC